MRETDFIAGNKEKWERFEQTLSRDGQDPEALNELYIQTTDDLSYSRTFYPNRSVRVYLNGLAQRTFLQLYRGRRGEGRKFFSFWTEELPLILYNRRRPLLVSLVVFLLAMTIGIVSYRIDPAFAEVIMGESYMDMTRINIENGDPMAVYKQIAPFDMALRITLHNIMVALLTFISGAFFALGSIVQLIRNGVMLGTFQYFFFDQSTAAATVELPVAVEWTLSIVSRFLGGGSEALREVLTTLVSVFSTGGVFRESLLTVWIHGALEISSIVIAGGAGLVMGSGLLFPGTLSRWKAFSASARDGLKIMLGTIPLFVAAGFLEGYATRHTEIPDVLRLLFILVCFAFIFWYYVVLPRSVNNRLGKEVMYGNARRRTEDTRLIERRRLRDTGGVLVDTLRILRRSGSQLFLGLSGINAVFCLLAFWLTSRPPASRYWFVSELFGDALNAHELFSTYGAERSTTYLLLVTATFYALFRLCFFLVGRATDPEPSKINLQAEFRLIAASLGLALCFAFSATAAAFFLLLFLPFLMTYAYGGYRYGISPKKAVVLAYSNLAVSYGNFLLIVGLALPCFWLIDSSVGSLLFAFLDWVVYAGPDTIANINVILQTILYFFIFTTVFCILAVSYILGFYAAFEIDQASGLLERIRAVGRKKSIRGMETEG